MARLVAVGTANCAMAWVGEGICGGVGLKVAVDVLDGVLDGSGVAVLAAVIVYVGVCVGCGVAVFVVVEVAV